MRRAKSCILISLGVAINVYFLYRYILLFNQPTITTYTEKPSTKELINEELENHCSSSLKLRPHSKVLSYTVFGPKEIYYKGIPKVIRNARNISLYKDWQIRIHHDGNIPAHILQQVENEPNVHFCDGRHFPQYGNLSNILKKLWRLIPIGDPTVDMACFRDLDSALLTREEDAVTQFIASGKFMHVMRDTHIHKIGMLAGMWCMNVKANRTKAKSYLAEVLRRAPTYHKRIDQPIINSVIWLDIRNTLDHVMQHDSYWCKHYRGSLPFPNKRKETDNYIGCPGHKCGAKKLHVCPVDCRPSYGKDWTYC